MKKNNPFIKPSGKMKGSQNIVIKGDHKSQGSSKNTNTNPKSKVMAKVFKAYPNAFGTPNASKVVSKNESARDIGKPISQSNSKRNLRFVGK